MDAKNWKYVLWTIAYAIGLVLVVLRIEDILRAAGLLLGLLRPLVFGIVIAFVLDHPFERLRGWFLRKLRLPARRAAAYAIVAVYLLAFGLLAALVGIVAPEVVRNLLRFAGSADLYLRDLQDALNRLTAALGLSRIDLSEVMALVDRYMGSLTSALRDFLPQIVEVTASVVSALATAFVSLALSVYIMSGKEKLLAQLRRCLRVYLPAGWQGPLGRVAAIVYEVFDNYVAGQCKEAVILGSLCFAGMTVLRLDYAGMVSVVVGVTALVPILGAYIGGAVGGAAAFVHLAGQGAAVPGLSGGAAAGRGQRHLPPRGGPEDRPARHVGAAGHHGGRRAVGHLGDAAGRAPGHHLLPALRQDVRSREARLPPGE